jgi:glutamine synthetase
MDTSQAGKGYLEDRRPAANMDPYQVCAALITTVCGNAGKTEEGTIEIISEAVN